MSNYSLTAECDCGKIWSGLDAINSALACSWCRKYFTVDDHANRAVSVFVDADGDRIWRIRPSGELITWRVDGETRTEAARHWFDLPEGK